MSTPKTSTFHCDYGNHTATITHSDFTTGYGTMPDGKIACFDCCAIEDKKRMVADGKIDLYWHNHIVSNWPGTLTFTPTGYRKGSHNIAGTREDFWFVGPDGFIWHGVQMGGFNEIAHCKRTKERWGKR